MQGGPTYWAKKTNTVSQCPCCWKPKDRNGKIACDACMDAGCRWDCGWRRGMGKNKDGSPNGLPLCPAAARGRRNGQRLPSVRTFKKGDGK